MKKSVKIVVDELHNVEQKKKEELLSSVRKHCATAAAGGLVPLPWVGVAVLTVNVWHMYLRINKILGISFKKNVVKSIASAAVANVSGNLLTTGVGEILKLVPGVNVAVGVLVAGANYAVCYSSAWIYLQTIKSIAKDKNPTEITAEMILQNVEDGKHDQQQVADDADADYVNEHKDDK